MFMVKVLKKYWIVAFAHKEVLDQALFILEVRVKVLKKYWIVAFAHKEVLDHTLFILEVRVFCECFMHPDSIFFPVVEIPRSSRSSFIPFAIFFLLCTLLVLYHRTLCLSLYNASSKSSHSYD